MADFQIYFPIFMLWLISTFLIRFLFKSSKNNNKSKGVESPLPPSPFSLPFIGHLHLIGSIPHQTFHKLSLRYGPVFRLLLGSESCIVVGSPETAKEFLKTNENSFLDRPRNTAITYLTYGLQDFMFAPYGPHWKFMKKIIMSELLNVSKVGLQRRARQNEIHLFMKNISQNAKQGKAMELDIELTKVVYNVIAETIMSKRCREEAEAREMRNLFGDITEIEGNFNISDHINFFKNVDLQGFGKRLKDIRRRYDIFVEKILKEHEEARKLDIELEGKDKDLLHILLDIADDKSQEIQLTREHIKAFIYDIIVAGSDTTSLSTEWALSEVINHPNVMKKAREEIDRVVGKNRLLQESDIPNLPYLRAIAKESLRLHPGGPLIPRRSTEDCMVTGYHIPANSTVFVNVWALGRDPDYWENPLEFIPERFIDNEVDMKGQHYNLLIFGTGKRMCPGMSFALQMLPATLGPMIQCFEWKAGKDGNLTRVDMEEAPGITLPRANPLVCVPVPRLDPLPF
uniref:cytochrome P450 93A3-like n=1 Tax=Erigeron canadensis TaxID=72917 RepID=UPI001CB8D191|nr:cytochrome P450 93A3-like [Erigeron canadensis]